MLCRWCYWLCTLAPLSRGYKVGAHQLGQLVVGLQAAQQAAELMVVGVLGQALVAPQHVARARHQPRQERAPLRLPREQRPPHRRQPHLLPKAPRCQACPLPAATSQRRIVPVL